MGAQRDYQPALDGVRAIAVAMVILFHAGFGWMSGGYLGVSVFFTLSGYLITTLMLRERAATGHVSMRRFYSRRARRLLPASLLCISGVMVARMFGEFDQVETLRRDALAALLQVFNWVRLYGNSSYADLFNDSTGATISPLEHYWSLSIEEQFYLIWPVALVGLVVLARRRRWSITSILMVVTGSFAVSSPVIAVVFGPDAAYWSTVSRLAEILIGATLASVLFDRRAEVPRPRSLQHLVALPAIAAIVVLGAVLPTGRGLAYNGWLPLFAIISASLIWSLQREGLARRALSTWPLVQLGRVSYGVYLFHWPIFLILRNHGWQIDRWDGFAVAVAVTLAVTLVSYFLVEQPIRTAEWQPVRSATLASFGAAGVVVVVALSPHARPFIAVDDALLASAAIQPASSLAPLVPVTAAPPTTSSSIQPSADVNETASATDEPVAPVSTTAPTTTTTEFVSTATLSETPPSRPVRVLIVGDSTSVPVGEGMASWSLAHPEYAVSTLRWSQGCGFIFDGTITNYDAARFVTRSAELIHDELPEEIRTLQPDVVVLMSTINDVADREWSADEGSLRPEDQVFRRRMGAAYLSIQNYFLDLGVPQVMWIVPPTPLGISPHPSLNDPVRYDVQHTVIKEVATTDPARVSFIDLQTWFQESGAAQDPEFRPDGVHMTTESATDLVNWYLGAAIVNDVLTVG